MPEVIESEPPGGKWVGHTIGVNEIAIPDLVLFTCTRLLGFRSSRPREKMRWQISGRFGSTVAVLVLEKFGLRLYVPSGTPEEDVNNVRKLIQKAAKVALPHLRALAEVAISAGHVTIENRLGRFDGSYRYFRRAAERAYEQKQEPPVILKSDESGTPTAWTFSPFANVTEGGYLAGAMLEAYFSKLEHLLVLVLPFVDFAPDNGALTRFVGDTWDSKFKTVFDINADRGAHTAYRTLRQLMDELRNPQAHGGFEKRGASFFFHADGATCALPAKLSAYSATPEMLVSNIPPATFKSICERIDEVDQLLAQSRIRFGLMFAESGLDPVFSPEARNLYRQAMQSEDGFPDFLDWQGRMQDDYANMDD
ncbi:MAG: hypothetical protein C0506_09425 [Anaerolinea sp.]|nr:hypothetical protein [Anaerolinea sp.]